MAKATVKILSELTLRLTQDEAEWLQNYIQNPSRENEDPMDTEMRGSLWNALEDPTKEVYDAT